MNKAAFLDRDGTINIDFGYVYSKERWIFEEKAIEAIKLLNDNNFIVIVITNQSGVARGYYKEDDIIELHNYVNEELRKKRARIDAFYYCPHFVDGINKEYAIDCNCRKPEIELYKKAISRYNIDVSKSIACGDKDTDTIAAKKLNISLVGQIGLNCNSLYDFVVNKCII